MGLETGKEREDDAFLLSSVLVSRKGVLKIKYTGHTSRHKRRSR
jgi:hypothetical protein